MTKILSPTAQINLLKRLRRMCPFAVWSGQYGYTCGGMKNGVRSSSGMGAQTKEARHCMALMRRLTQASIYKWLRHNDFKTHNQCLWLKL